MSRNTSRRARAAVCAAVTLIGLCVAGFPGEAAPTPLAFGNPVRLPRWLGGEPSLAFDPDGKHLYVVAPQRIPTGINPALTMLARAFDPGYGPPGAEADSGVGLWISENGGRTFSRNANIGSSAGGGDSDVVVAADHTVYVADLELAGAAICVSTNFGRTFSSGLGPGGIPGDECRRVTTNHQGPDNDRQWLTLGRRGEIYLTYHDFAFNVPVILRSTDRARTFLPCGSLIDPAGPAAREYDPLAGDLIPKPVVSKDGSIYATITLARTSDDVFGFRLDRVYAAVASGGCTERTIFRNYLLYADPGADLKLFQSLAIDGAGTLYAVAAGRIKAGQVATNVWLFTSRNGGRTWSKPVSVNPPSLKANVMPAVVGGLGRDQVAIGWFGTSSSGDPDSRHNQWRYYVATSRDGGRTFSWTAVTRSVIHYGDICTQGLFCDANFLSPGNRNLADFSSLAVNPKTGCVAAAFPGDPHNRSDLESGANDFASFAYVSLQSGGACLR
jgi:hypothetical protein